MSVASVLIFIRYMGVPIAFAAYLLFQLLIKKKKWKDLQSDAIIMLVFVVLYYSFIYFIYKSM